MDRIVKSFYRTVIEEDRYVLLLQGIKNTLIISVISVLFGTILGICIAYLRQSKNKYLSLLIRIVVSLIQGIPITLLLLIFYYVIFSKINIEPIIVAIISFSIYFSAYISEVFRGAFNSINKDQVQAAYAMGLSKIQTLKYITLPQALVVIIPTFKNEVVSLIKLTSIAGYISIIELTKASDIIRNRTYEAFFPLIVTAILYLFVCWVIGALLNILYKKINPRFKKEVSKYVKNI